MLPLSRSCCSCPSWGAWTECLLDRWSSKSPAQMTLPTMSLFVMISWMMHIVMRMLLYKVRLLNSRYFDFVQTPSENLNIKQKTLKCNYRTVHTDSTLWTIIAFKMRKWFPNIFESLYLHITSDLIELYISNK